VTANMMCSRNSYSGSDAGIGDVDVDNTL